MARSDLQRFILLVKLKQIDRDYFTAFHSPEIKMKQAITLGDG